MKTWIAEQLLCLVMILYSVWGKHQCDGNSRRPSEETLQKQYTEWLFQDDFITSAYYLNPELAKAFEQEHSSKMPSKYRELSTHVYGKRKCKKQLRARDLQSNNTLDRSSCPSYVDFSYSPERYPTTMLKVGCRCNSCYGFDTRLDNRKDQTNKPTCEPISIKTKILIQKKSEKDNFWCNDKNEYIYEEAWEDMAVACVCVMPKHSKRSVKIEHKPSPP